MNWAAGWILTVGTYLAGIASDPLAVYRRPVDGQGLTQFWMTVTAALMAVGCVGYLLFAKPLLRLENTRLVILNPLRVWNVRLNAIEAVGRSFPYPSVRSGGRRIFIAGLEESNLDLMKGGGSRVSDLATTVREDAPAGAATNPGDRTTYTWSIFDKALAILLAGWLLYLLAGVFRALAAPWS